MSRGSCTARCLPSSQLRSSSTPTRVPVTLSVSSIWQNLLTFRCIRRLLQVKMQALPSIPTSPASVYVGTWNADGVPTRMPVQPPNAPSAFANYMTSVLPSQYSAYSALDSPCPQQPFVAAFGDIRTSYNECIFYLASPPISRIACMCTSFYQDMLDVVTASWPAQCGSGDLASIAIAKGTQAVADVCRWQSGGAATVPVTLPLDKSYAAIYTTPSSFYATITPGPSTASSPSSVIRTTTRPYATPARITSYATLEDDDGLTGAAAIGLAIGGGSFGLLLIAAVVLVTVRKRRARRAARERNSSAEEVEEKEKPDDETEPLPAYSKPPSYMER